MDNSNNNNNSFVSFKLFKIHENSDLPINTGIVLTGIIRLKVAENGQLVIMKDDLNNIRIINFNEKREDNSKRG